MMKLETALINGKRVVVKGIGKLFYQDGFPISMAVSMLRKQGYEVSILNVADECMKNGWSGKTTFNKLKIDFEDDADKNSFNLNQLEQFCLADYEVQRELIFNYLFNSTYDDVRNGITVEPLTFLREQAVIINE